MRSDVRLERDRRATGERILLAPWPAESGQKAHTLRSKLKRENHFLPLNIFNLQLTFERLILSVRRRIDCVGQFRSAFSRRRLVRRWMIAAIAGDCQDRSEADRFPSAFVVCDARAIFYAVSAAAATDGITRQKMRENEKRIYDNECWLYPGRTLFWIKWCLDRHAFIQLACAQNISLRSSSFRARATRFSPSSSSPRTQFRTD